MTTKFIDVVSVEAQIFSTVGTTLADCMKVAALFDNTCDINDGPIDFASYTGETMSCTGQMMCPLGDGSQLWTSDNPCTFTRKLCVTCNEQNGVTYIRTQSNEMPNHCFQATNENPTPVDVDW